MERIVRFHIVKILIVGVFHLRTKLSYLEMKMIYKLNVIKVIHIKLQK